MPLSAEELPVPTLVTTASGTVSHLSFDRGETIACDTPYGSGLLGDTLLPVGHKTTRVQCTDCRKVGQETIDESKELLK